MPKAIDGIKICSHCRRPLPISSFHYNRTNPDGLQAQCKDCKRESNHTSLQNPEVYAKYHKYQREWWSTENGKAKMKEINDARRQDPAYLAQEREGHRRRKRRIRRDGINHNVYLAWIMDAHEYQLVKIGRAVSLDRRLWQMRQHYRAPEMRFLAARQYPDAVVAESSFHHRYSQYQLVSPTGKKIELFLMPRAEVLALAQELNPT